MESCTELRAVSCPNCGDCSCEKAKGAPCFDDSQCPLHGLQSKHAPEGLVEGKKIAHHMEFVQGVKLSENDLDIVSRFAQMISEGISKP